MVLAEPNYEHLLVALAAGDFGDLLDLVTSHNDILRAAEEAAAAEARLVYEKAVQDWLSFLDPIIENNAGKTFAEIAARPDVQFALVQAMGDASDTVRDTVVGGWAIGQEMGIAHALQELGVLGLDIPDLDVFPVSSYLSTLTGDLDAATTTAVGRILAAAETGFDTVDLDVTDAASLNVRKRFARQRFIETSAFARREGQKLSTSAARASSVAVNRGYSEKQLEAYISSGATSGVVISKVWVTNFSPATCPTCASLHGTVVDVITSFDGDQTFGTRSLGVYQDLLSPPRHPHCRCRIMPFVEGEVDEGTVNPATMREFGQEWAEEHPGMAPATFPKQVPDFSEVSQNSQFLTSADVKAMSDGQFSESLDVFLRCILDGEA